MRVVLRVRKTRHEAVASIAHTADFWAFEGEIEFTLVGLRNAYAE